jgi:hypothetical protein
MSDVGGFIDAALQYEVSPYSYPSDETDGLLRYGTSVGAIRGTIRDVLKRYPGMSHDDIRALSFDQDHTGGRKLFGRRGSARQ